MVMVQLSKPWKSKVRTVNNFRVLARLPLGELGSASQTLCTCTLAGLGVASVLKGTHRACEATGGREASNKGAGHPRPGDASLGPAPALPAEGRGPTGPGSHRPSRSGPRSPGGGLRWGPSGDTPTPLLQAIPGDAHPNRAASRRATAPGAGTLLPAAGSAAPRWRRSLGNRGSRTKAASRGPSDSYQRAPRAPTPASTSAASVPAPVRCSAAAASRRRSALMRAIVEMAARTGVCN